MSGSASSARSSGSAATMRSPAPTAMTISGTPALAAKKRARRRSPRVVPVDAQQDSGPRNAVTVQRVDDRDVPRLAVRPLAAAEVDREFGLVAGRGHDGRV